jgi:hypothetical protein
MGLDCVSLLSFGAFPSCPLHLSVLIQVNPSEFTGTMLTPDRVHPGHLIRAHLGRKLERQRRSGV